MGMALGTKLSVKEAELEDLYEIVDGKKVWPRVGEPEPANLYEIVNGECKEIPRMGAVASVFASVLMGFLNAFGLQRKLGMAVVEVLFELGPGGPSRRPDIAFIRFERWPLLGPPTEDPPKWQVVPNLTAEVLSPTNTVDEIEGKLQDYFASGVELAWVIHPIRRRVYVYEALDRVRVLTDKDELDGGNVLPGFRLSIADLFAGLVKPN